MLIFALDRPFGCKVLFFSCPRLAVHKLRARAIQPPVEPLDLILGVTPRSLYVQMWQVGQLWDSTSSNTFQCIRRVEYTPIAIGNTLKVRCSLVVTANLFARFRAANVAKLRLSATTCYIALATRN